MSPRQIINDSVSEEKVQSENLGTENKFNIVTIFSEQVEIVERQDAINKQMLIQNQRQKSTESSNAPTA